ncbi:hypothetical protein DH96_02125 [Candidatus Phytoplasma oryzae]|uniref:Uncharacterized protein n=1 Tax=Candidatus Phytoplasma oryzae TaxID=203274 RepID=A0A328ILL7_9MOLU|nr:hypothetical protein [Candidatus Phytoplasma oryzae]RAM57718.1 hypothetical protein DH96_02125 [Candidatus Phytoplasma oryzae]
MKNKKRILDLTFFLLSLSVLILSIFKGYRKPFFSFYLFTRQVVLLINLTFLINLLFDWDNKYALFICALDSFMMMILYLKNENHHLLAQRTHLEVFISVLEHYFLTTVFLFYYFLIDQTVLKLKHFYLGVIHLLVYLIAVLYLGHKYHSYPYDFLNPHHPFFLLKIGVLSSITIVVAILFLYVKEKKIRLVAMKSNYKIRKKKLLKRK